MNQKMTLPLAIAIAALGLTQVVQAQSSSTSVSGLNPESTMTRKEIEVETTKGSGVIGGAQLETDYYADQEPDGDSTDNELTLNLGYKFNDVYSVYASQRVDYTFANSQGSQKNAEVKALRIFGTQKVDSFLGSSGSQALRLQLPTTRKDFETNLLVEINYQPDLTWDLTRVWNIEYQGNHAVNFYGGSKTGQGATKDAFGATKSGEQRTEAYTENFGLLNFKAMKGLTVFQSFGAGYYLQDSNTKLNLGSTADVKTGWNVSGAIGQVSTGVNADLAKNIKGQLYAVQYVPFVPSETEIASGSDIEYVGRYSLYRPEQTKYEAVISASF